jgi:acyl-coenzyme A thioesterase PaaI-like protein
MASEPVPTVEELNRLLADTPFLQPYGFRVDSTGVGECTLIVPFRPELERPGGIVSGMTMMGAADVAMWLAIMTLRGMDERWVTSDMKTAFLKSVRSEGIACVARVLKPGKRTIYGTAECRSEGAGLIAHHVLTYARVEA